MGHRLSMWKVRRMTGMFRLLAIVRRLGAHLPRAFMRSGPWTALISNADLTPI